MSPHRMRGVSKAAEGERIARQQIAEIVGDPGQTRRQNWQQRGTDHQRQNSHRDDG